MQSSKISVFRSRHSGWSTVFGAVLFLVCICPAQSQQLCGWLESAYPLSPTGQTMNSINIYGAGSVTVPIFSTVPGGCSPPSITLDSPLKGFVGLSMKTRDSQCPGPTAGCFDEYHTLITIQNTNPSNSYQSAYGYVTITASGTPDLVALINGSGL